MNSGTNLGTSTIPTTPPEVHGTSDTWEGLNSTEPDLNDEEVAWINVLEHEELANCLNTCVDRWRNAGPESRKKMYALFAVAGIFLAVCRHGHVLVICDMIRSGELYVSFFLLVPCFY